MIINTANIPQIGLLCLHLHLIAATANDNKR